MQIEHRVLSTRHGQVALRDKQGTGSVVLFLHGSGSSADVFEKQLHSTLLADARLLAIDLPGHGLSDDANNPTEAYTVTGLAEAALDVVKALGLTTYSVVGWSLGGHVAVEMLSLTCNISGVLLTGTPPVQPGLIGMLRGFHPSFDLFLASKPNFSPRDIDRFLHLCFGDAADSGFRNSIARADGRLRSIFAQSLLHGTGVDQKRQVENASMPLAFINGSQDPFVRSKYLSTLQIPLLFENRPHIVEDSGHAVFWQSADEFNRYLARFLNAVEAHNAWNPEGISARA